MLARTARPQLCWAGLLFFGIACVPPQALPSAPAVAQDQDLLRVLPVAKDKVFPRIIPILMDLGYQVRDANADLGHVSLSRAWNQEWMGGVIPQSMEATLYFQAEGPAATRVRVLIQFQSPGVGKQIMDPGQGKALLEAIEKGLLKTP